MSLGHCAAVLKTASRANPAVHLPYRPRLRATPRFASRNVRRYDWSASSGSVVANDPVNRVDPTGLYQCDGDKEQCGAVSKALNTVREAAASGNLSKSELRILNGILKTYGAEGKANGVVVTFRTPDEISKRTGGTGVAVTAWSDKYKTAVIVLPKNFARLYDGAKANPMAGGIRQPNRFSPQVERGNVLAHEGRHAQDQLRAGGYAGTNDANAERRGYEAGRAVNHGFGTIPARDLYGPDQNDDP